MLTKKNILSPAEGRDYCSYFFKTTPHKQQLVRCCSLLFLAKEYYFVAFAALIASMSIGVTENKSPVMP